MTKVAVLGGGAWGTALAKVLADKGNETVVWSHRSHVVDSINKEHENKRYLPEIRLPSTLRATGDMETALRDAAYVVVVVPSHALREVMVEAKPWILPNVPICSATKGIENKTLMLMSEVLLEVLGTTVEPNLTYLSGPSFAKEVALVQPTAVVVASSNPQAAVDVQRLFATEKFRVYTSDDVVGVEVGGALKNVIAIAAGAADGLGFGYNARAGLITRGLNEIGRLAVAKGANPLTLAGLSGLGDLVLTCTGELSRNRTVGFEMGRGRSLPEVLRSLGHVAEGVKTTKSAYDLSVKLSVDMPITSEVYQVLYEEKSPEKAVTDLLNRALTKE